MLFRSPAAQQPITDGYEYVIRALNAGNAVSGLTIPSIGDQYPIDIGAVQGDPEWPYYLLNCSDISVNPLNAARGIWEIVCTYTPRDATILPPQPQNENPGAGTSIAYAKKSMATTLQGLETNILYGEQTGTGPETFGGSPATIDVYRDSATKSEVKPHQSAKVTVMKPQTVLRYQRHELVRTNLTNNTQHLGKVNSGVFAGYAAGQVLFTSLTYEPTSALYYTQEAGSDISAYIATYEFQIATTSENWKTTVAYQEENNLPYIDATWVLSPANRTLMKYLTYEDTDFLLFYLEPPV